MHCCSLIPYCYCTLYCFIMQSRLQKSRAGWFSNMAEVTVGPLTKSALEEWAGEALEVSTAWQHDWKTYRNFK